MMRSTWFLAFTLAACAGTIDGGDDSALGPQPSPWPELDRIQQEGPPRYTSRVHSCPKMRYATLGNLLTSRGVAMPAASGSDDNGLGLGKGNPDGGDGGSGSGSDSVAAGAIYAASAAALAAPNYASRVREVIAVGIGTESTLFDIFAQAAPELIANMGNQPACMHAGQAIAPFDSAGHCNAEFISCLTGIEATQLHVDVCNQTIARADTVAMGQQLAVAAVAAAAHTCE